MMMKGVGTAVKFSYFESERYSWRKKEVSLRGVLLNATHILIFSVLCRLFSWAIFHSMFFSSCSYTLFHRPLAPVSANRKP